MALRLIINHKKLNKYVDRQIIHMICHSANSFVDKTVDVDLMFMAVKEILPELSKVEFVKISMMMKMFDLIRILPETGNIQLTELGIILADKIAKDVQSSKQ